MIAVFYSLLKIKRMVQYRREMITKDAYGNHKYFVWRKLIYDLRAVMLHVDWDVEVIDMFGCLFIYKHKTVLSLL